MAEILDAPRRAQLRSALETEEQQLRARIAEISADGAESLSFDDGFADASQVTAERGELEAIGIQLAETLHDVEDALTKLDNGTYGLCETCGGPIGDDRLEAMPAARHCITDASASR
jgi:RNA polymerase-binding transcription factor DksA